ncbi:DNA-directed DNA polymerase gamma mip1 [Coemansia erecta]|uniref:Mitochondrial DNA polymerase catalytic subunit n=1 Tax=Coemansia erecta TaxID=147472 RepID=A0A9W7XUT9_9FUNG|nr:DNA-directed DNA polymerase gamma mip1 [Coemansia erecta]
MRSGQSGLARRVLCRMQQRRGTSSRASTPAAQRTNAVGIPLLGPQLQQSIFPTTRFPPATPTQQRISQAHLSQQGITPTPTHAPTVDFTLPALQGQTIDEHFQRIGRAEAEPFLSLATQAAEEIQAGLWDVPMPDRWIMQAGWTRYGRDGRVERVVAPDREDRVLVFDVEVTMQDSAYPTLAVAQSRNAWYAWVSPYLSGDSTHARHLIPLLHRDQGGQPRLVVGHNVAFDRARVLEARRLRKSGVLGFVDTMSLHVACGGLCNQQRAPWKQYARAVESNDLGYLSAHADVQGLFDTSALNSLRDVARHYCGITLDKSARDVFVSGAIGDVRRGFAEATQYCARDVAATGQVFSRVFGAYLEKCPHPVSFAGMLEMLDAYLPVDRGWDEYVERCEHMLEELTRQVGGKLRELAEQALRCERPLEDPWLRHLDWRVQPLRMTKGKVGRDGRYVEGGEPRPYARQRGGGRLAGKPQWYCDLWDAASGDIRVSVRARAAPYLLRLTWLGHPLYHSRRHGWTFRVPRGEFDHKAGGGGGGFAGMTPVASPMDPAAEDYDCVVAGDALGVYVKVPHADGAQANCGSPLAKSYQAAVDDGTLASAYPLARDAMRLNALCAYWVSARARIKSQFVVWDQPGGGGSSRADQAAAEDPATRTPLGLGLGSSRGVILPMVVPMGTVTRRAVEATWMTAANAGRGRVGSELKAMVRAPEGIRFVGADVDSEELWLAALLGDAQLGGHGATALGWMTLQGTKAQASDLHSRSAAILGISRGAAKVFNYGRIYGAGLKHAVALLRRFNPGMALPLAQQKAEALYRATKGQRSRRAAGAAGAGAMFWHGGAESFMFNRLEAIATAADPRTPALSAGITGALQRRVAGTQHMTSRVNWAVQSSGVDYLHMLLVATRYLARTYQIDMRFALSVHDEVRYMVHERHVHRAALALQVANAWVRGLFSFRVGIEDLPAGVAFFSAVDIDWVLRKEVDLDCVTPTNPTPVAPGRAYAVHETLELTGGRLEPEENVGDDVGGGFRLADWSPVLGAVAPGDVDGSTLPLTAVDVAAPPDDAWLAAQASASKPRPSASSSVHTRIVVRANTSTQKKSTK